MVDVCLHCSATVIPVLHFYILVTHHKKRKKMKLQNIKNKIQYLRLWEHILTLKQIQYFQLIKCGNLVLWEYLVPLKAVKTSLKKHFCLSKHEFLWAIKAILNKFDSSERTVFLFGLLFSESFPKVTLKIPRIPWELILLLLRVSPLPPKQRAAIMPQCFQWNVSAIVIQDDSHWEDSPAPHPLTPSLPTQYNVLHSTYEGMLLFS